MAAGHPDEGRWDVVRFVHTADWQLGMTRRFLGAEAQARFTAARIDAVRRIGAIAAAEGCAFVLVCGDVFESNHLDRRVVVRSLEAIGEVPVPVHLLPGNHDPLDPASVYRSPTFRAHRPANVHVLDGAERVVVAPGVELVAAPWTSKRPGRDLVAEACADLPADGTLRIVAGHGAVDTLSPDRDDRARIGLEALEGTIASGAVHYVGLGDRHSRTDVGGSGRIWYPGAPEPTDFVEVDPGHALVVDLTASACAVTAHPVATWHFEERLQELHGAADVEALAGWLASLPAKDRTVVRLTLVGELGLDAHARLLGVLDHQRDLLAAIQRWEKMSDLVVLPSTDDLGRLDLHGFAARACEELRSAAAAGGEGAPVAADALALLHRLAGGPARRRAA
jgi:DNA repair exonuclease SbcCD nuclease subunit